MPANAHQWNDITEHGGIMLRETFFGLTKREAAAIAAMQGAWWNLTDRARPQHIEHAAKMCVAMADALFEELDK